MNNFVNTFKDVDLNKQHLSMQEDGNFGIKAKPGRFWRFITLYKRKSDRIDTCYRAAADMINKAKAQDLPGLSEKDIKAIVDNFTRFSGIAIKRHSKLRDLALRTQTSLGQLLATADSPSLVNSDAVAYRAVSRVKNLLSDSEDSFGPTEESMDKPVLPSTRESEGSVSSPTMESPPPPPSSPSDPAAPPPPPPPPISVRKTPEQLKEEAQKKRQVAIKEAEQELARLEKQESELVQSKKQAVFIRQGAAKELKDFSVSDKELKAYTSLRDELESQHLSLKKVEDQIAKAKRVLAAEKSVKSSGRNYEGGSLVQMKKTMQLHLKELTASKSKILEEMKRLEQQIKNGSSMAERFQELNDRQAKAAHDIGNLAGQIAKLDRELATQAQKLGKLKNPSISQPKGSVIPTPGEQKAAMNGEMAKKLEKRKRERILTPEEILDSLEV